MVHEIRFEEAGKKLIWIFPSPLWLLFYLRFANFNDPAMAASCGQLDSHAKKNATSESGIHAGMRCVWSRKQAMRWHVIDGIFQLSNQMMTCSDADTPTFRRRFHNQAKKVIVSVVSFHGDSFYFFDKVLIENIFYISANRQYMIDDWRSSILSAMQLRRARAYAWEADEDEVKWWSFDWRGWFGEGGNSSLIWKRVWGRLSSVWWMIGEVNVGYVVRRVDLRGELERFV
jgi:hypothetical protein